MEVDPTDTAESLISSALEANPVLNVEQESAQDFNINPEVDDQVLMAKTLKIAENRYNSNFEEEKSQSNEDDLKQAIDVRGSSKRAIQNDTEEVPQKCVEAIKRRRRSTFLLQPAERGDLPPPADDNCSKNFTGSTEDPTSDQKALKSVAAAGRRRSTANRRSVCAVLPPLLTVAEQVSLVAPVADGSSCASSRVLCQLLDISIRDPLSKLCHQHPGNEQFAALKGVVMLSSEQLAEDTSRQLTEQKIMLPQLAAKPQAPPGNKATSDTSLGKGRGAAVVTKRQHQESDADAHYKQWLLSEYGARTQRLLSEYREWKQLRRTRMEAHNVAKREWAESRSGGGNRIGEEQHSLLSPAQRAFLAAAPDYSALLRGLAGAVEQSGSCAADYEKAVCGLQATRLAAQATADRAYFITEAAVYSGSRATLRCHLHDLQETCADADLEETLLGAPRHQAAVAAAH